MRLSSDSALCLFLSFVLAAGCGDPNSQTEPPAGEGDPRPGGLQTDVATGTETSAMPPATEVVPPPPNPQVVNSSMPSQETEMPTDPLTTMDWFIADQSIEKSSPRWRTKLPKPPLLKFDNSQYFWNLETNKGPIKIRLMAEVAPMHASNTIYLTRIGFYDGLKFHRVIQGFMAQGGCPVGSGSGSPGYEFDGEFDPKVVHDRPGLLSMANRGPGTDGSQFFLTFVATPHLDGLHTIFGEVVAGMDTVRTLEKFGSPSGYPTTKMEIETATIVVE